MIYLIFLSRNIKQYDYKAPINCNNKDIMYTKLTECFKYISDLKKSSHGNLLINSRRNAGFLGFCISISLIELYDMLNKEPNSLPYLCTYKLSQDHLELFFSIIRQQFGCNNNPSAKQSAMKKILLHLELKENSSENCIPLSNINILHFTSSLSSIATINKSADNGKSTLVSDESDCDNEDLQIYDIALYCDKNFQIINRCSRSIISYIAGFVIRFLIKRINCEQCVDALTEVPINSYYHDLISIKNKGGLLYPLKDVIFTCETCEKLIRMALIESDSTLLHPKYNVNFFLTKILRYFTENNRIFSKLQEHTLNQIGIDNHIVHLIRIIATKYVKVRLQYMYKNATDLGKSDRHHFNKIILFKDQ